MKLDLSIGTPLLAIVEKSMDLWLELYRAAPEEKKAELAGHIIDRQLAWERIVDRFVDRLLDGLGKEE